MAKKKAVKHKRQQKSLQKTVQSKGFQLKLFYVLITITLLLSFASLAKAQGLFIPVISDQTIIDGNIIHLDQVSLEQKVAQMIVVHGGISNQETWQKMQIGGIHLFAMESEELYKDTIQSFQEDMAIPFFVTTDLEGCQNSFANFREFIPNDQITTVEQAAAKGIEEGEFLQELGFTINFAPVVDLDDTIWGCRSFQGGEQTVAELSAAYTAALQSFDVSATAKHYPGKTLVVSDPHQNLVSATIDSEDLVPYESLVAKEGENLVDLIMVSHIIVDGEVSSNASPSSVSTELMHPLKESYAGLIISDDILMRGLQDFYEEDLDQLYIDLVLAGHDLIINFNDDPNEIYYMIQVIVDAIDSGIIDEAQIDASFTKIVELKGFTVE